MRALPAAEQATLGALLLHPESLPAITEWLRAGDFADPWHGQLYALLRERLVARQTITPEDAGMSLLDQVGPHKADLPRLASLLTATPPAANPLRYAPMVLEASLRREVAGQGVIVRASALATSLSGGPGPVEAGVAQVGNGLREAERRWQLARLRRR
jgi:replicative DNA helicase